MNVPDRTGSMCWFHAAPDGMCRSPAKERTALGFLVSGRLHTLAGICVAAALILSIGCGGAGGGNTGAAGPSVPDVVRDSSLAVQTLAQSLARGNVESAMLSVAPGARGQLRREWRQSDPQILHALSVGLSKAKPLHIEPTSVTFQTTIGTEEAQVHVLFTMVKLADGWKYLK
ncbi:MAG: hypothetical protein HY815_19360 [Candidatus Riflebacteria bacterium]|nr:hypothetical protein [Candidatus Riflebacteria bacterium]